MEQNIDPEDDGSDTVDEKDRKPRGSNIDNPNRHFNLNSKS